MSGFLNFGLPNTVATAQVSDTTGVANSYKSRATKKHFKSFPVILLLCLSFPAFAQTADNIVQEGNKAYQKAEYKNAEELYKEALSRDGNNLAAKFNLGNALLKQNNIIDAAKYYAEVSEDATEAGFKAKALYNKGLTMVKYQKLPEAIEAFKQSLLLAPDDNDTRENLQKAMEELRKQQQQQPQQQPKEQKKPQPQKQQNKMPNKDVMEQKFDELRDKEKQLQKLLQRKSNTEQPEKDW